MNYENLLNFKSQVSSLGHLIMGDVLIPVGDERALENPGSMTIFDVCQHLVSTPTGIFKEWRRRCDLNCRPTVVCDPTS